MPKFVLNAVSILAFSFSTCSIADEVVGDFPPECPYAGTMEIVEDPAAWADLCFKAVNGRLPAGGTSGDSLSFMRDIDLDGVPELLESRGTGSGGKQIYVFRITDEGPAYIGMLPAHPWFYVAYDKDDELVILNIRRMGYKDVYLEHIQYVGGQFIVTHSMTMQ